MIEEIKEIEQYYTSHLKIENKEDFEKAISDLYNDLGSLEAYNLLV
ncbi:hypothetical protein ACIQGW_15840 [Lysinibacillus xylanilyticus]